MPIGSLGSSGLEARLEIELTTLRVSAAGITDDEWKRPPRPVPLIVLAAVKLLSTGISGTCQFSSCKESSAAEAEAAGGGSSGASFGSTPFTTS